ncbi:MAG TPA: exodeoxyribonuclease III [Pseudonocardiaceae bacterium]|nr:exodeoxyribonuclease III [Pseudonocardiaceae bacterium]
MLTVSTVNVNGVRAAAGKGLLDWLAATAADVVCLQETRAARGQLPELDGWHVAFAGSAVAGRNGVAVLSRNPPEQLGTGFGVAEFADSGRYVEVALPGLVVASVYLPKGDAGTARQAEKERFMAGFLPYLAELRDKAAADGREVLVCGDWNIAHTEADLKAWRANLRHSGFLPEERAWLDRLYAAGFVDVVRALRPGEAGPYTWWSYRGRAYDNDAGWRIDLHVATPGLAERARTAVVERADSYATRWSDHAPVTVRYDT